MTTEKKRKKNISPERILEAMFIAKKKMEEKDFHTSTLNFSSVRFSAWNDLRVYLIEKKFIEKQHITYAWIGGEPTIEMAFEYIDFYRKRYEEKKKSKDNPVVKEPEPNDIYSDYLILKKRNQELTTQNGKLYEELKDSVAQRKLVVEKFSNFINGDMVSQFRRRLRDFESELEKFDFEEMEKSREMFSKKIQMSKEEKEAISKIFNEIAMNFTDFQASPYLTYGFGRTKFENLEIAILEEVANLKHKISKLDLEIKKLNSTINDKDERINSIQEEHNDLLEKSSSYVDKINKLYNTISELEFKLKSSKEYRNSLKNKTSGNSLQPFVELKSEQEKPIKVFGIKIGSIG